MLRSVHLDNFYYMSLNIRDKRHAQMVLGHRPDGFRHVAASRIYPLDERLNIVGRETNDHLAMARTGRVEKLDQSQRATARIGRQKRNLNDRSAIRRRLNTLPFDKTKHRFIKRRRPLEIVDDELAEAELRVGRTAVRERVFHPGFHFSKSTDWR